MVPVGISQRIGRMRIVKAMKSIRSKAEKQIIDLWLVWMRSFPKALRLLMSRSFDSISFLQLELSLHTLMKPLFVFLIYNCLYHDRRLFIAFHEEVKTLPKEGYRIAQYAK